MKLLGLELIGFKSFPKKTSLVFHPGITVIVGPNGCGKSNFVDAMRWVLGEQNPRMLRGERMDDAIFKGTATRKPLGLAEVTITLSNEMGELPIAFSEVSLTRRLFKSGESHYMINKSQVRLKDITDLIAGTGLGLIEYSLIDQKLVDMILDDSTSSRRELIEEAAGVASYKRKRHLARKKLEAVESDLRRLGDIISEVERNVDSLGRHVKKARRYKQYRERQEELDVYLSSLKISRLSREEKEVTSRLSELEEQVLARKSVVEEGSRQIAKSRERAGKLEEEIRRRRIEIEASQARKNELDGDLRLARERLRLARERLGRIGSERDELLQKRSSLCIEKERVEERIGDVEAKLTVAEERQTRQEVKTAELNKRLEELMIHLDAMRQSMEEEYKSSLREEACKISLREEIGGLAKRKSELESILDGESDVVEGLEVEGVSLSDEIRKLTEIVNKLQAELRDTEQKYQELFVRRESYIRVEREKELEFNNVNARLEILKGGGDGGCHTSAIDYAIEYGKEVGKPVWRVADLLVISNGYSRILQSFLREFDNSVVTEDLETALELISSLREKGIGTVSIISLETTVTEPFEPPDIEGALRASAFVECPEKFSSLKDYLFGNLMLVPANSDLRELVMRSYDGITFASTDDSFMVRRGMLTGGKDLERSTETFADLNAQGDQIMQDLTLAHAQLTEVEGEIKNIERGRSKLASALHNHSLQLQGKEARAHRVSVELETKRREHERLRSEHTAIIAMLEEKGSLLRGIEESLCERTLKLDELREARAKMEKELDALRDSEKIERGVTSDLKVDVAALSSRLREVKILRKKLCDQIDELESELRARDEEEHSLQEKIESLTAHIGDLENGLELERSRVKALTGFLNEEEEKLRIERREAEDVGASLEDMRSALEGIYQERNGYLVRKKELSMTIDALVRRIEDEYDRKIDLDGLSCTDEIGTDTEELESELADIKRKIHYMGSVNMVALEEYESAKERYDFLTAQRDDLCKSREDLEHTIRRLNRVARDLFRKTFDEVRENFTNIFSTLFRGGDAGLELSDATDLLESEIRIFARPKGKRQQSIELLSGGERALAAIAFLFSLYLVKSSPFCILDEVDAPLDDANILRFTSMLKEYSDRTQFIIITHNKRTMEAADYMYGVSMEEPGVSKVVSIKLDGNGSKKHQKTEEAIQIVDEVTV